MSGTRFARSGRCRFFICLGVLVLIFGMVAIFHSSQTQLDETRDLRLRCEQQREQLNEQLQSILEQKFNLGKNYEQERNEHLETRRSLEQKLKEASEAHAKEQMEARVRYDKLQQTHKLLQSEHNELVGECGKSKKRHLEDTNSLEKKLQTVRSELQKTKSVQEGETTLWKEKYNAIVREKSRLELLLNAADAKTRVAELERTVAEYQAHCDYKPSKDGSQQQQINKPLNPPDTTRNASPQPHSFDKPRNEKAFFSEQEPVSDGLYRILIVPKPIKKLSEETETQLKQQPLDDAAAAAVVVAPLSAPRKTPRSSTEAAKSAQMVLEANARLKQAANATASTSSSSSGLPPLPLPPNQRKLPENVAPIPANFEDLLQREAAAPNKLENGADTADIDAAVEEMQKNENDDGNNNRYANVVNDMEHKGAAAVAAAAAAQHPANEDSGAHEIKDHDFINDQNFNLPAEEDNNFFDGGGKNAAGGIIGDAEKRKDDDEDEDMMGAGGAGDIAVKNHNHLLDNLNNEVAGDQGKEFHDGIRLEDGNDEDEDEDDYSNPAARQQGEQAIRN